MSELAVHFSSRTDEWETPQDLFDELDAEFDFTLDPCATTANAKCSVYFTRENDGLAQDWRGVVFVNPPYGHKVGKWVRKAYESAQSGATVVCLLPSRTDTRWWHDYVMRADEIRFIKGRLRFGGAQNSAPFPSAVVVFRHKRVTPQGGEQLERSDAARGEQEARRSDHAGLLGGLAGCGDGPRPAASRPSGRPMPLCLQDPG